MLVQDGEILFQKLIDSWQSMFDNLKHPDLPDTSILHVLFATVIDIASYNEKFGLLAESSGTNSVGHDFKSSVEFYTSSNYFDFRNGIVSIEHGNELNH